MWLGHRWVWIAALLTTAMLSVVFVWRSSASWMATAAGEGKAFAATLITLMLMGSVASIIVLPRFRRAEGRCIYAGSCGGNPGKSFAIRSTYFSYSPSAWFQRFTAYTRSSLFAGNS